MEGEGKEGEEGEGKGEEAVLVAVSGVACCSVVGGDGRCKASSLLLRNSSLVRRFLDGPSVSVASLYTSAKCGGGEDTAICLASVQVVKRTHSHTHISTTAGFSLLFHLKNSLKEDIFCFTSVSEAASSANSNFSTDASLPSLSFHLRKSWCICSSKS